MADIQTPKLLLRHVWVRVTRHPEARFEASMAKRRIGKTRKATRPDWVPYVTIFVGVSVWRYAILDETVVFVHWIWGKPWFEARDKVVILSFR